MSALAELRYYLRPHPTIKRAPYFSLGKWAVEEIVARIDELNSENDWLARRVLELEALTPWPRIPSVLAQP